MGSGGAAAAVLMQELHPIDVDIDKKRLNHV